MCQRKGSAALLSPALIFALSVFSTGTNAQQVVTKPRAVVKNKAAILSATLAVTGAQVPLCEGVNDLLPVTFSFPVSESSTPDGPTLNPELFEVTLTSVTGDSAFETTTVTPKCATLAPAAESDERRTVLLLGSFAPEAGVGPIAVEVVGDLSLSLPDGEEASVEGKYFCEAPAGPEDFLGQSNGPIILDYELFPLPSDATADMNGCDALFPGTTDVVRLIFASGVRERNLADSTLSPLGASMSAERANAMFEITTSAARRNGPNAQRKTVDIQLLGIADADVDNYSDLCLAVDGPLPKKLFVHMRCDDDDEDEDEFGVVFNPAGNACSSQMVRVRNNQRSNKRWF